MRLLVRQGVRCWMGIFLLVLSLGMFGCNSPIGTVSGKVYYKNVALKGGNVTFFTADKSTSLISPIGEDGSYRVENLPVGVVKISVETKSLKKRANLPKNAPPPGMKGGRRETTDPKDLARRFVAIPELFASPETSGLTYTVQGGNQTHDIKLP